ncbi:hypothetical protein [Salinicola acroporae]|uniref:hypothetical protein n=1 Tax=Salinicola acroporae TaxID=1541440 RepID=UPI003CCEDA34
MIAAVCLALIVIVAILAPWLAPHDPLEMSPANRLKPPVRTTGWAATPMVAICCRVCSTALGSR